MARQTINVNTLRIDANRILSQSTCNPERREGVIALLEHVLTQTGNYHGFRYLTADEVPLGELPGIVRTSGEARFPDETRRYYS
jgi:hypothetical protein